MAIFVRRDRRVRQFLVRYPRALPLAIFVLIAAVTLLSVYSIELAATKKDHAQLRERASAIASTLERRGATTEAYLRAGASLFGSTDEVTPEIFIRFVRGLKSGATDARNDGIGWAPYLRNKEIAPYLAAYQRQSGKTMTLSPQPGPQTDYVVPVAFLHPDAERNQRALGFDMASEAARREALEAAMKLGEPVASGKLVLKQEGQGDQPGFVVYMPVYDAARSPSRLKGFVYAPFNALSFVNSALVLETRGDMGLRLYDRAPHKDNLLVDLPPAANTGVTVKEPVRIGHHDMILEVESARGNSLSPLSLATLLFGTMVATLLMLLVRLLTRQVMEDDARLAWLEEQNSIRTSLTRELNHRVKNTLANVLSILALTRRKATNLEDFAESLDGRIRALSATHDLLTQSDWGATPIRSLIEAELAPYARQSDSILEIAGPDLSIAPNDALSLGLAIHELATNAAKYGALSQAGGKLRIEWEQLSEVAVQLRWMETGGPPIPPIRKPGFGTNLIEKIVAHELRNPVELDFHQDGVRCTLIVPLRQASDFALRAR